MSVLLGPTAVTVLLDLTWWDVPQFVPIAMDPSLATVFLLLPSLLMLTPSLALVSDFANIPGPLKDD